MVSPTNLPTNRTLASTPEEHLTDSNTMHGAVNDLTADGIAGLVDGGAVDNSAAFTAAYLAASAAADSSVQSIGDGSRRGRRVIEIPAGVYKITSAAAMMSDLGVTITTGLAFRGQGREMTHIVFSPSTADQYLLENFDWKNITFEDLTFHSTVPSASFMKLNSSTGAVQNLVFNRVNWAGTWKYGFHLTGADNLDTITWLHCRIKDTWNAFLYSDATTGSDQYVNYNFVAMNAEYTSGNFIDMAKGGNINFWGGSLIHVGPAAGTFFALRGGSHASGTQRLLVEGARVEHRHLASKLIYSEWQRGNVTFNSIDASSQAALTGAENMVTAEFVGQGELPHVVWDGCQIMGKHSYLFDVNSSNYQRRISYRDSTIRNHTEARDFVTIVNGDGTANVGGTPPVEFENCRGNSLAAGFQRPFDCTLNWELAKHAQPKERRISLKNSAGALPVTGSAATEVWLPRGSVITGIRFHKEAGGTASSTNFTYPLTTSEATPTVLATGVGNGTTAWSAGFDHQTDGLWFVCNTEEKRHLLLTATNITQSSNLTTCVVEYLG